MTKNKKKYVFIWLGVLAGIIGSTWCLKYSNEAGKIPSNSKSVNVLLIAIDSLRADHLSCYGYKRKTSPNIDNLAKQGTLFTQAIAQGSWTSLSLPSIITSTYVHTHGVMDLGYSINPSIPTLAEVLRDNGYYTALISGHGSLSAIKGFERGFDTFIDQDNVADKTTQRAISWLKTNQNEPFFLWLHYMDPHSHYRPPPPYDKMYLDDMLYKGNKHAPILNRPPYPHIVWGGIPRYVAEGDITDVDYYISQYDGEISFTDEQIKFLLMELEKLNLSKRTLIILFADHGESLGEHNYYFSHGALLYDSLIKVPLIIRYPGIIPKNKIIDTQVQLIDIAPTILGALKIRKYEEMEGVNLLPLILGEADYPTQYAFSEASRRTNRFVARSIRTKGWKLIYTLDEDKYELYNLKDDPGELVNLVEIEKEKYRFLRQKLDNWMRQAKPKAPTAEVLDEETKERLRKLGYF